MHRLIIFFIAITAIAAEFPADLGITGNSLSPQVQIRNLNAGDIRWTGGF